MNAVLRQKAGAGKQVQESRAMSPARAFRLALTRAGAALGLPLEARSCEAHIADQRAAISAVADMGLILRLVRGDGQPGVLAVDTALLASLVECQILGRVLDKEPADRAPTDTDAALAVPFAEGVLREVLDGADLAAIMRVSGRLSRPGLLDALLTQPNYRLYEAEIEITAERQGKAVMVLPLDTTEDSPAAPSPNAAQKDRPAPATEAPAALHAVLCRVRRPLLTVRELKVGDVLTLPHGVLLGARLEFDEGTVGVDVELGRLNGYRAVRLAGARPPAPPDPAPLPRDTTLVAGGEPEIVENENTPPGPTDGVE